MKFTKEEISLCKQVAQMWRKPIKYGDWFLNKGGVYAKIWPYGHNCKRIDVIPLWTISDCLEFLRDRALYLLGLNQSDECEFVCGFCEVDDMGMRIIDETAKWVEGTTPLEACLKAVLAVLEEEEK